MRPRRYRFFLLLGFCIACVILILIQRRTAAESFANLQPNRELIASHGEPTLTLNKRTAIMSLPHDLKWLKELDKQALLTFPNLSSPNCSHSVFLVILVISSPGHFQQRNAIRSSWAKLFHSRKNTGAFNTVLGEYGPENLVKTVFLVGNSDVKETQGMIDVEAELYDDIVSGNFDDKYENLVLKTRLGLTWTHSICPSAYVLKTDDDVFVNIRKLVEFLLSSPETDFYTGWCNYRSKVIRNKLSKWYVSVENYGEDEFPPYCLGGGYLMSSDILSRIIKITYTEHLLPLEDVFVGIAINKIKVQPLDNRKLFNLLFSGIKSLCDYLNVFLLHPVNTKELLNMHLQANLARKVCHSQH